MHSLLFAFRDPTDSELRCQIAQKERSAQDATEVANK